jgi:hypothetical protein
MKFVCINDIMGVNEGIHNYGNLRFSRCLPAYSIPVRVKCWYFSRNVGKLLSTPGVY